MFQARIGYVVGMIGDTCYLEGSKLSQWSGSRGALSTELPRRATLCPNRATICITERAAEKDVDSSEPLFHYGDFGVNADNFINGFYENKLTRGV